MASPHRPEEDPPTARSIWSMGALQSRDLQRLLLSPLAPLFSVTACVFAMLTHRGAAAYDPRILILVMFSSAVVASFAAGLLGARPKHPVAVLTGLSAGGSILLVGSKLISALISADAVEIATRFREMLFWSLAPAILLSILTYSFGHACRARLA